VDVWVLVGGLDLGCRAVEEVVNHGDSPLCDICLGSWAGKL
jgi:hypothetical protein